MVNIAQPRGNAGSSIWSGLCRATTDANYDRPVQPQAAACGTFHFAKV